MKNFKAKMLVNELDGLIQDIEQHTEITSKESQNGQDFEAYLEMMLSCDDEISSYDTIQYSNHEVMRHKHRAM